MSKNGMKYFAANFCNPGLITIYWSCCKAKLKFLCVIKSVRWYNHTQYLKSYICPLRSICFNGEFSLIECISNVICFEKWDLHSHLKTYLLYKSNLGLFTLIIIITTDELQEIGKSHKVPVSPSFS